MKIGEVVRELVVEPLLCPLAMPPAPLEPDTQAVPITEPAAR